MKPDWVAIRNLILLVDQVNKLCRSPIQEKKLVQETKTIFLESSAGWSFQVLRSVGVSCT